MSTIRTFLYRLTDPAAAPPCSTACCCSGWRLVSPTGSGPTVTGQIPARCTSAHQGTGVLLVAGNAAPCRCRFQPCVHQPPPCRSLARNR
jgi:hypothetical protein